MAQSGRASSKKSKPSYSYAIIGIALVLFLFGIVGWFFLNLRKTGDFFKENIQVNAYLSPDASKKRIDSVVTFLSGLKYTRKVEYTTKEKAIQKWNAENDTTWKEFLDENPLPESVDFYVKAKYVNEDSLTMLSTSLQTNFPGVISDFKFPTKIVAKVSNYVKTAGIIFFVLAMLLTVLVVFSIDNTIRLAMYSNRFLIKTMQMVGATRGFIAKPINQRALINGLIASIIAIVAIWFSVIFIEKLIPDFKTLHDNNGLTMLFFLIVILGIIISLASTHRAVIKYLKMKLDDLY